MWKPSLSDCCLWLKYKFFPLRRKIFEPIQIFEDMYRPVPWWIQVNRIAYLLPNNIIGWRYSGEDGYTIFNYPMTYQIAEIKSQLENYSENENKYDYDQTIKIPLMAEDPCEYCNAVKNHLDYNLFYRYNKQPNVDIKVINNGNTCVLNAKKL